MMLMKSMKRGRNKLNSKNEKKVIAVIPAYNESKYIFNVVKGAKKHVDQVIVVDDASSDNTGLLAKKAGALVLRHPINLGLGGTLKTGCDAAILLNANIIVTLDGDGQHDPNEIGFLIAHLKNNDLDAVFGQREFNNNMPFVKKIGNRLFHRFSKHIFGIKVRDTQTGFRAFTSEAYKKMRWKSSDYAVASEMLINAEKHNLKYAPFKVETIYHDDYKGTTALDGMKIAGKMINIKLNGGNSV